MLSQPVVGQQVELADSQRGHSLRDGRSMSSGEYRSQYFFGALNGKWGFRNPAARKNGWPRNRRNSSIALSQVIPSGYALSGTSGPS